MSLAPRFRRVAALQRHFVDREQALALFAAELASIGHGPRVLNVTGVGGIGKSRFLRECVVRADTGRLRTATIDLHVPAMRHQEDALAVLRRALGAQEVGFDRFDLAYAVLWQRLHPNLQLSRAELSLIEESAILTEIMDSVAGIPVFGTAHKLVKLLEKGRRTLKERHQLRHDPTLQSLDDLPNKELADAVTFLFAEDLRLASESRGYLICVDTYEALVSSPLRGGRTGFADVWLRDLVAQLDRGLVMIGSREPLRWDVHDQDWADVVRVCDISGLPMPARLELLQAGGVTDVERRRSIAVASAGLPFYLNLAVDSHLETDGVATRSQVSPEEILARFLEHVAVEEIRSLEVLSLARVFDFEIFQRLAGACDLPDHRLAWESLVAYSFVFPAETAFRFHQLMRETFSRRLPAEVGRQIHAHLQEVWQERADRIDGQDRNTTVARALREATYHRLEAGGVEPLDILQHTDRAVAYGGHTAADGIMEDLDGWLTRHPDHDDLRLTLTGK